jgi:hypothetical protein
MLFPTMLHGTNKDVKRRSSKAAKALRETGTLAQVVESQGMTDLATSHDLIFFGDASYFGGHSEGFHTMWLPLGLYDQFIDGHMSQERYDALYDELVRTAWGTLLLCSRNVAQVLCKTRARRLEFARALQLYQAEFVSLGKRFENNGRDGDAFVHYARGAYYVLANLGAEVHLQDITEPFDPNELIPLEYFQQALSKSETSPAL